jgi:uncharacterized protein (DUF1697 family)
MATTKSYAALLRGVNVGGRSKLSMPALVELCRSLGHEEAASYIQSGNLVFRSSERSAARIASGLEAAIRKQFGLDTRVILRTHEQLEAIAAASPFDEKVHVVFLERAPTAKAIEALDSGRSPGDRFSVEGSEIYLSLAGGAGRTKLTLDWFERNLGVAGTQRNWNTVLKLAELTAARAGG